MFIAIDTDRVGEPKQQNIQNALNEMDLPGYSGKPKVVKFKCQKTFEMLTCVIKIFHNCIKKSFIIVFFLWFDRIPIIYACFTISQAFGTYLVEPTHREILVHLRH